jgi:hypothetical protein
VESQHQAVRVLQHTWIKKIQRKQTHWRACRKEDKCNWKLEYQVKLHDDRSDVGGWLHNFTLPSWCKICQWDKTLIWQAHIHICMVAIQKVTSGELLTKQAMRKRNFIIYKNMYILKLLLNILTFWRTLGFDSWWGHCIL